MLGFIIRRLIAGVVTIWAASVLAFLVIQLPPGDYVTAYVAQLQSAGTIVTEDEARTLRIQYGLDQPIYVQYAKWVGLIMQGNFGMALEFRRPVLDVIGDRLALTMVVSVAAIIFIWALALPIGIYSAVRQYSIGDYLFTFIGFLGIAVPNFMLALIVLYIGFKYLGMTSIGGLFSNEYLQAPWSLAKLWDMIQHLPLPALILGMAGMAELIRIMRANLLDELRKPYVVTARAKGLSEFQLIMKYPVRAALNPFASTIGYLFPFIVSGSIIVSLVLSLPTVGPLLYRALIAQDLFLASSILLLLAVMTVIGTFISDLILMWIDPRIRLGMEGER
jgi:peptide/nickel transport system permease protein